MAVNILICFTAITRTVQYFNSFINCEHCGVLLLNTNATSEDMRAQFAGYLSFCAGDPICDQGEGDSACRNKHVPNSNNASSQSQAEVATNQGSHWKTVYITSISTFLSFLLLVVAVIVLVTVCVCRSAILHLLSLYNQQIIILPLP